MVEYGNYKRNIGQSQADRYPSNRNSHTKQAKSHYQRRKRTILYYMLRINENCERQQIAHVT